MDLIKQAIERLPEKGECEWQGVWMRMPGWVEDEDGDPARPYTFIWVNPAVDLLHPPSDIQLGGAGPAEIALRSLASFARKPDYVGGRPTSIMVNDEALAAELRSLLAGLGIEVRFDPKPGIVRHLQESFYEYSKIDAGRPGLLQGDGVTVERARSFADAAARFFAAAPWEYLTTEDPIGFATSQQPAPNAALSFAVVMGAAGETFGLAFYESLAVFEERAFPIGKPVEDYASSAGPHWSLMFRPMHELPPRDADLWEDEDLPVADDDEAYPTALCYSAPDRVTGPNARELLHLEACLRALTDLTEQELDRGGIQRTVATGAGPIELTMTLPYVLDPPSRQKVLSWGFRPDHRFAERGMQIIEQVLASREFESEEAMQREITKVLGQGPVDQIPLEDTPRGRARDLLFQAYDCIGWRKRQLARKALTIDADCTEAYVILAETMPNPVKALEYYHYGIEAGERELGPERFETGRGRFWAMVTTRPYMRALGGAARGHVFEGDIETAKRLYWKHLDLDAQDARGLKHEFLLHLMATNAFTEALSLVDRFPKEAHPSFPYARALLLYERDGDTTEARQALREAIAANRLVADLLLHPGKREKIAQRPDFEFDLDSADPEGLAYASTPPLLALMANEPETRAWLRNEFKRTGRRGRKGRA